MTIQSLSLKTGISTRVIREAIAALDCDQHAESNQQIMRSLNFVLSRTTIDVLRSLAR